ncbi:MAG: hypothetical protein M0Z91_03510 [Actinomycetota bacterium]|nr:hypothetical protein [Actinomycetota bacterium]
MISGAAPPAETTQYEGDQKCAPHRARVTSGQCCWRTRMEEIAFRDMARVERATLGVQVITRWV